MKNDYVIYVDRQTIKHITIAYSEAILDNKYYILWVSYHSNIPYGNIYNFK